MSKLHQIRSKQTWRWTIAVLGLLAFSHGASGAGPAPAAAGANAGDEHPFVDLSVGDQISLEVFGQPDMNSTLYVGKDGTISVPLAGAVAVAGMTPVDAAKRVEAALEQGQYLVSPHVTITVLSGRSFYIYGEVASPNKYRIEPGMTVIQAIARAGGITPRGSERRVDIRRLDPSGHYVVLHARADDLVKADDVIRVKESIF